MRVRSKTSIYLIIFHISFLNINIFLLKNLLIIIIIILNLFFRSNNIRIKLIVII